jgi:hypothetical protein
MTFKHLPIELDNPTERVLLRDMIQRNSYRPIIDRRQQHGLVAKFESLARQIQGANGRNVVVSEVRG